MNLSQHLAMTMQLQQAIQILQLSSQDLCAVIEKEYLENPVLEMEYPTGRRELYEQDGSMNVRALADYLDARVFADAASTTEAPDANDVAGFEAFFDRFRKGLPIEHAAIESIPLETK